jgi:hypothetical protein
MVKPLGSLMVMVQAGHYLVMSLVDHLESAMLLDHRLVSQQEGHLLSVMQQEDPDWQEELWVLAQQSQ